MKNGFWGFLAFGIAAAAAGAAAPSIDHPTASAAVTLDELVRQAVAGNSEIAFYRAEVEAAGASASAAGRWTNPELSVELGQKRVKGPQGRLLGDGAVWSVSVAQAFEFPGRISLRKAIANRQVDLAMIGLAQGEAALAARARGLGYALLGAEARRQAALNVAARLQALLEALVQREPAGITPLLDQRIIEAGLLVFHRRLSAAADEAQAARIELNLLRGLPADAPLKLQGDVTLPDKVPPTHLLVEAALEGNFELRLRRVELEQQGFRVDLVRKERWPALTVSPYYASERAIDEETMVGVGLSVPLPLWNRDPGDSASAQARQQQAEAALRLAVRDVEREVTVHALALQSRLDELGHWRSDALEQFRSAAEMADEHYQLGAVPMETHMAMQIAYLDALEALLAIRGEALERWQKIEVLTAGRFGTRATPDFTGDASLGR